MNSLSTDHGSSELEDSDFHEALDELGDHDITEAPQISTGGHVTERSDSQKLPDSPEEKDERIILTEQPVDLHVPKGSSSDILSSQEEERRADHKSSVEEKEASTLSQYPQDQQQQQKPPPVDKLFSDPHVKREQVSKIMEEDIQHPKSDQEGKALQDPEDAGDSPSINSIRSGIEELQGAIGPILRSQEEEKQDDPQKLGEETEASIPSQNPPDQQQQQQPLLPVKLPGSDHPPLKEAEEAREFMAESGSHSFNMSNSTVQHEALQPPISEAEEKSAERVFPSNRRDIDGTDDKRAIGLPTENLLELQPANHEGKAPGDAVLLAANSHSFNSMESNKLQPPNYEAREENSVEKEIDSTHNPHPRRFFSSTKALFSVIASTFALLLVMKLFRRS